MHVLVTAVIMLSVSTVHAGERKARRAQELSDRAMELLAAGDAEGANRKIGKALRKDPDDPRHHFRQAEIYTTLAARVGEPVLQALLEQGAAMHYQWVAENTQPGDLLGVLAGMNLVEESAWLVLPEPSCTEQAQAHWDRAEQAFGQRDVAGAKLAYAQAVELCPEHPTLRVYYGDAFHLEHDFDSALEQYTEALELEPCHWQAHRFMADTHIARGEGEGALDHLVDAVACNPGYDPAWAQLGSVLAYLGVELRAPQVDKLQMLSLVAADSLPGGKEPSSEVSINARVWTLYAQALEAQRATEGGSAIEQERAAVRAALAGVGAELAGRAWKLPGLLPWAQLAQAERDGMLDAAIFVFLHDASLAEDFVAWRDDNHEAFGEWIVRNLAAPPSP